MTLQTKPIDDTPIQPVRAAATTNGTGHAMENSEDKRLGSKRRLRPKQLVKPPEAPVISVDAQAFFARRLDFETDPADVHHDLSNGVADFVIVDARQKEAYEACHIPGAIHLPYSRIRPSTLDQFDPKTLFVTYCWGPGCNSSTKAALKLSELGFTARDMIGGIEYWRREGYEVEGSDTESAPLTGSR